MRLKLQFILRSWPWARILKDFIDVPQIDENGVYVIDSEFLINEIFKMRAERRRPGHIFCQDFSWVCWLRQVQSLQLQSVQKPVF